MKKNFFEQKTLRVAHDLIGAYLVRRHNGKIKRYKITEVEAYIGPHDLASHSAKGRTPRTEVMFGPPGTLYIYFIYGVHWMLNIVTEKKGYPAAVLIRGVEGASGPGRITKMLGIDKKLNGKPAIKKSGLWFERGPRKTSSQKIMRTPRIGVDYAGEIWAQKKYRFVLEKPNAIKKIK